MENCEYARVLTKKEDEIKGCEKNSWKPLMRQCLITSGVCCTYFLQGLFLGAPTVLVAQMRRVNSTEIITDEILSWLTTMPMVSAIPFVVILPLLFNRIGRKYTIIFVWLLALIGFTILYNSSNLYHIVIGELFSGATTASTITIAPAIIAEYTLPKYRGVLLALKGATAYWGIWVSNAIGTYFYWKNISITAFVCSIYIISVMAWPESPYWLAKRGRYEETAKSHRWLKGVNEDSEKELAQLIISKNTDTNTFLQLTKDHDDLSNVSRLSRTWLIITSRPFYKPVIIIMLLLVQYNFTGKLVISMYAVDILKHLTPDESFVYKAMLILDGVTVFSMYVGCVLARYLKRRTMLIGLSGSGILILYLLSFYLYLASLSLISKNDIVILLLLSVFSIAISSGPIIMCTSLYGELVPSRCQNIAMLLIATGGIVSSSVLLKLSPVIFKSVGMHGCFLFFAITSTILLIIMYIHLPETKDKTIQEIEEFFTKTPNVPKILRKLQMQSLS